MSERKTRAKKSYGQHFLTNEHYAHQIAHALELADQYDHVLEVGPGQGMLTKHLLARKDDFELTVSEADKDMISHLEIGLIGNYPYNISSQIMIKMLDNYQQIPEMVGMFQKEVADRVLAGHGSKTYGVIGVLVQ